MNGASSRNVMDRAASLLRLRLPAKFERPRGIYIAGLCLLVVVTTALVGSLYEGPWYWQIWYGFFVSFLLPILLLLGLLLPLLALAGLWLLARSLVLSSMDALHGLRSGEKGSSSSPTPSSA
ncbi:MAG: hypothetical protein NTY63_01435 [Candidatus Bipolaricaulota bacterium]|nr:hypothetical protein [Candidatus Bipolaricaulota bacterium]